jgi:hypothetical protein
MRSVCHTAAEFPVLNGGLSQYSRRWFLTPDITGTRPEAFHGIRRARRRPRSPPLSTADPHGPPGSGPPPGPAGPGTAG